MRASVAATGSWTDPDGFRMPSGEVHAWLPGRNQTLCGLSTKVSALGCFADVDWADVQPVSGRDADRIAVVCPRCASAMGTRRDTKPWRRRDPGT
jgi:hypothetical protein